MTRGQGNKFKASFRPNTALLLVCVLGIILVAAATFFQSDAGSDSPLSTKTMSEALTGPTAGPGEGTDATARTTSAPTPKSRVTNWGLGAEAKESAAQAVTGVREGGFHVNSASPDSTKSSAANDAVPTAAPKPDGKLVISKWRNELPAEKGCGTFVVQFNNTVDVPIGRVTVVVGISTEAATADVVVPYRGSKEASTVTYEMVLPPGETKTFSRYLCVALDSVKWDRTKAPQFQIIDNFWFLHKPSN